MKLKLLAAAVAGMVACGAQAELVWTKAPYTTGEWSSSPANILPSATCTLNGGACGELVNGLVSKTQTVNDNNTFECTFLQPEDLGSIGFYSFHTDGGRDGIGIDDIQVKTVANDEWTSIPGFVALAYGMGNNNSSAGRLSAVLADDMGDSLADGVTAMKVCFGKQDNSWTPYAEIEVNAWTPGANSPCRLGSAAAQVDGTDILFAGSLSHLGAGENRLTLFVSADGTAYETVDSCVVEDAQTTYAFVRQGTAGATLWWKLVASNDAGGETIGVSESEPAQVTLGSTPDKTNPAVAFGSSEFVAGFKRVTASLASCGGLYADVTAEIYADSGLAEKLATQTKRVYGVETPGNVVFDFADLPVGTYTLVLAAENEAGLSASAQQEIIYSLPSGEGTTAFTWTGWGDGKTWGDPANWGFSDVAPTSGSAVTFPANAVVNIDLGGQSVTCGKLIVGKRAHVTIANGAFKFGASAMGSAEGVLAQATLAFDAVAVTINQLGTHYSILGGARSRLEFLNGSSFSNGNTFLPYGSGTTVYFEKSSYHGFEVYPGASGGPCTFVFVDCPDVTVNQLNFSVSGNRLVLTNSTIACTSGGGKPGQLMISSGNRVELVESQIRCVSFSISDGCRMLIKGATTALVVTGAYAPASKSYLHIEEPDDLATAYPTGVTVPVIKASAVSLASVWTAEDSAYFTRSENVRSYSTGLSEGVAELNVFMKAVVVNPAPECEVAVSLCGKSAAEVALSVFAAGEGAESVTNAAVTFYSDSGRTIPVSSVSVPVTGMSAKLTVDGLTVDETYYYTVTATNDRDFSQTIEGEWAQAFPPATSGIFYWRGWGDGTSWDDPNNWGVSDRYPCTASDAANFPTDGEATVDLGGAAVTLGKMVLYGGAKVCVKNGELKLPMIYNAASDTSLVFDGAALTLTANAHVVYGTDDAGGTHDRCDLAFVNGAALTLANTGDIAWLPGSQDATFLFRDSTVTVNEFYPGWNGKATWQVFDGATVTVRNALRGLDLIGPIKSPIVFTNTVLTAEGKLDFQSEPQAVLAGVTKLSGTTLLGGNLSKVTLVASEKGVPGFAVSGGATLGSANCVLDLDLAGWAPKMRRNGVWPIATAGSLSFPAAWTNGVNLAEIEAGAGGKVKVANAGDQLKRYGLTVIEADGKKTLALVYDHPAGTGLYLK